MTKRDRAAVLKRIERNIRRTGFHLYVVTGGEDPRFAYTIGLRESLGTELVLAGAAFYVLEEVALIVHSLRDQLAAGASAATTLGVDELGQFTLRQAHTTWTRALLLGAMDYYGTDDAPALQVVPDAEHWTVDVPDMAQAWSATAAPVWQWLHEPWPHPVPSSSHVATNLVALRGAPVTEVMRWEEDYWEAFAGPGPDVTEDQSRFVPLATLLAADASMIRVVSLPIGRGLWRDEGGEWQVWTRAASSSDT